MTEKEKSLSLNIELIKNILERLPFPFAIIFNSEIIWSNKFFVRLPGRYNIEAGIKQFLSNPELQDDDGTENKILNYQNYELLFTPVKPGDLDEIYILSIKENNKSKIKEVAHDLNNNLNTVINSIDILKEKLESNSEVEYLLSSITNHSNMAIEHVNILLNNDTDKNIYKNKINANKLLNDLYQSYKITLPGNIKLSLSLTGSHYEVYGNYNEIYSALLNILYNAKESIKNEGNIIIKASKILFEDDKNINGLKNGNYLQISIKDTGSGIDGKNLEKIFSKEFSTKNKTYTSGIGLFNVKKIITKHNGAIEVRSKLNEGTEFTIYLPLADQISFTEDFAKSKTILIAEDEEALLKLLSDLFLSYKFNVIPVTDGKAVLSELEKGTEIDLLIIDRKMPKINGIDCILEIKKLGFDFPIILATGSVNEDVEEIDKTKVAALIRKPYNFESILALAEKLIV